MIQWTSLKDVCLYSVKIIVYSVLMSGFFFLLGNLCLMIYDWIGGLLV